MEREKNFRYLLLYCFDSKKTNKYKKRLPKLTDSSQKLLYLLHQLKHVSIGILISII